MISFKFLTLVALALLPSVHSSLYTIAVKYDLSENDSDCAEYAAALNRISDSALVASRAISSGNSKKWTTYDRLQDRLNRKQEKLAKVQSELDAFKNAMIDEADIAVDDAGRRLDGCYGFCEFMCDNNGIYCGCCSCCGGGRRKRNLRALQVDDEEALDAMEDLAEDTVLYELKQLPEAISCLAYPYSVTVDIMSEEETPEDFATKKEKRLANRAAKRAAKKATNQYHEERRKELKAEFKATQRILKAARIELAQAQEADRAAKEVERAASKAQEVAEKALAVEEVFAQEHAQETP